MITNLLKLNDDKMEFILFAMHQQLKKIQTKPIAISSTLVARVDYIQTWVFYGQTFEKSPLHQQNNFKNLPTDQKHKKNLLQVSI